MTLASIRSEEQNDEVLVIAAARHPDDADEFGDVVLRAYALAVAQSLLLQDGIKVLLITLVSPQVAPSLLRPELNTKRARALRRLMRLLYAIVDSFLN